MATAAAPQPVTDRYDMSPAAIYSEDRWQEPFAEIRKAGGIVKCENSVHGPYWNIASHQAIQHVEALPDIYSSSWEYGGITILERSEEHTSELPSLMRISYADFCMKHKNTN